MDCQARRNAMDCASVYEYSLRSVLSSTESDVLHFREQRDGQRLSNNEDVAHQVWFGAAPDHQPRARQNPCSVEHDDRQDAWASDGALTSHISHERDKRHEREAGAAKQPRRDLERAGERARGRDTEHCRRPAGERVNNESATKKRGDLNRQGNLC